MAGGGEAGGGWGRASARGCEREGRRRRGAPRSLQRAGAQLRGSPQLPPSWLWRRGAASGAPHRRACPSRPGGRRRRKLGPFPRPNGRAQSGLLGDESPGPTGFGFEWVPSSHSSSDKMEDVVSSCCSHDGRWGDYSPRGRGEAGSASTALRAPEGPTSPAAPTAHWAPFQPLPGLGPRGGLQTTGQGGRWGIEAAPLLGQSRGEPLQRPVRPGPGEGRRPRPSLSRCPGPVEPPAPGAERRPVRWAPKLGLLTPADPVGGSKGTRPGAQGQRRKE